MAIVGNLFVQNPAGIFLVSGIFFGIYFLLRNASAAVRPRPLLWVALAWALWAAWEFAVVRFSPEADIRVDLLLIVPVVLIASVAGVIAVFWPRRK